MRFVLMLWCGVASFSFADEAQQLHELLAENSTLSADFIQHQYSEEGDLIETSEGNVALQKPNQVRWHVFTPFEQLIVSDGVWLWQYDVELEQAVRRPHPENLATTPLMVFVEPLESLRAAYQVSSTDQACYLLQALDDKSMFANMTLCFDEQKKMQSMTLVDGFGQKTDVYLNNIQQDVVIDSNLFTFIPSDEVEVVFEEGYVPGI